MPTTFSFICGRKFDKDETLTDLSFEKENYKDPNSFNSSKNLIKKNLNLINIKSDDLIKKDLIHSINQDYFMKENDIIYEDLKNAEINFNSNDFYHLKINDEFVFFVNNNNNNANSFEFSEY